MGRKYRDRFEMALTHHKTEVLSWSCQEDQKAARDLLQFQWLWHTVLLLALFGLAWVYPRSWWQVAAAVAFLVEAGMLLRFWLKIAIHQSVYYKSV